SRVKRKFHTRDLRKSTGLRILSTATNAVFERRPQRRSCDLDLHQFVLERQDRQQISLRQSSRSDDSVSTNGAAFRETDVSRGRFAKRIGDEVANIRFPRTIFFTARVECNASATYRFSKLSQKVRILLVDRREFRRFFCRAVYRDHFPIDTVEISGRRDIQID